MELYQPNPDRVKAYWRALQDLWLHLYSSAYPTAAAITVNAFFILSYQVIVKDLYTCVEKNYLL